MKNKKTKLVYVFTLFFVILGINIIGSFTLTKIEKNTLMSSEFCIEVICNNNSIKYLIQNITNNYANTDIGITQEVLCTNMQLQGCYYGKKKDAPDIKSGRFFLHEDYLNNRRIAVIGESILGKTYEKNHKRNILIDGDEYEVIGILDKGDDKYDFSVLITESVASEKTGDWNSVIIETEEKEVKENLIQMLKKMKKNGRIYRINEMSNKFQDKFNMIMQKSNDVMYSYIVLVMSMVIFLNVQIKAWFSNYQRDIKCYFLLGTSKIRLFFIYFKKYFQIYIKAIVLTFVYYFFLDKTISLKVQNGVEIFYVFSFFILWAMFCIHFIFCYTKVRKDVCR